MSEPTPSTSSSTSSPPARPLVPDGYPFNSSALDTTDYTPPPSNPTSPIHSPPRSPRHSSSYPNKARPLSPRPNSQSMAGVISSHNTATSMGSASQKKKHRASFDVHLPTIGLLSAAGGPHTMGTIASPVFPTEKWHRFPTRADDPEHNITVDQLSPGRRRVLEDCLKLFCSQPSLEILERSWNKDATFEDPIAKCHGFHEYAPQWFAMPKAFPHSKTLSLHLHNPSPSNPSEFIWEQVQEYTIRGLGTKKIVHSLVVLQLDEDEKVLKFEDRWDAKELPTKYGSTLFRKLNAKVVPWLVSVPKEP